MAIISIILKFIGKFVEWKTKQEGKRGLAVQKNIFVDIKKTTSYGKDTYN